MDSVTLLARDLVKNRLMDFFVCLFCALTSELLSTSLLLKVILVRILYHIHVDACEQFEGRNLVLFSFVPVTINVSH